MLLFGHLDMTRNFDQSRLSVDGADIIPYDPLHSFNPGSIGASIIRGLHPTNEDRTEDFNNISAGGPFVLTPGSYLLGSTPNDNDSGIVGFGASFSGSISPRAVLDAGITNKSAFWAAKACSDGFANYAAASQLVALPSGNHDRSFESAAHIASIVCYDESTYVSDGDAVLPGEPLSTRDYVAKDGGVVVPGNLGLTRCRVWGDNVLVSVGQNSSHNGTVDAYVVGNETRIDNWGADSPYFATSRTKTGHQLIAGGNKRSTCASFVGRSGSSGSGYYRGFVVDGSAVSDYAYSVIQFPGDGVTPPNMLWGVSPEGAEEFKGGTTPPSPSAGRVRVYYDALGRLFALFPDGTSRLIVGNPDNIHMLTSGEAYEAAPQDEGVIVNKTTGSATFIAMPKVPSNGQRFFVKDGKGDAAANPITILVLGDEFPIDGAASAVISTAYGKIGWIFVSNQWLSI